MRVCTHLLCILCTCWYSPTCVQRRYGDGSSVLGSCCGWGGDAGCFTYPDSVILGWHDPTYITEKQLPSGKSLSLLAPDTFAAGTPATGWKVDVPSRTGWCVEWIYVCALCSNLFWSGGADGCSSLAMQYCIRIRCCICLPPLCAGIILFLM